MDMEYRSERGRKAKGPAAWVWIALPVAALLAAGLIAGLAFTGSVRGVYDGLLRMRNTVAFYVLGHKPQF